MRSMIPIAGGWQRRGVWAAVLFFILLSGACQGGRPGPNPTEPVPSPELTSGVIAFYRGPLNHLNAVRYGSCPMHPTCSEYARQAVAAYGPLQGWIMAMDRLLRCGRDETRLAPVIYVNGKSMSYDPLPARNP